MNNVEKEKRPNFFMSVNTEIGKRSNKTREAYMCGRPQIKGQECFAWWHKK